MGRKSRKELESKKLGKRIRKLEKNFPKNAIFDRAKKDLEELLKDEEIRITESYPLSIYFFPVKYPKPCLEYNVEVGKRLDKVFGIVSENSIPETELKEIEIESLYSIGPLNMHDASVLASRIYQFIIDCNCPCEPNFRTFSEENGDAEIIGGLVYFSCQERYKQNNET